MLYILLMYTLANFPALWMVLGDRYIVPLVTQKLKLSKKQAFLPYRYMRLQFELWSQYLVVLKLLWPLRTIPDGLCGYSPSKYNPGVLVDNTGVDVWSKNEYIGNAIISGEDGQTLRIVNKHASPASLFVYKNIMTDPEEDKPIDVISVSNTLHLYDVLRFHPIVFSTTHYRERVAYINLREVKEIHKIVESIKEDEDNELSDVLLAFDSRSWLT